MSAITFLPPEIIGKILSSLSPRDLKSAVLVCRMWREVGESSSLWSWARAKIYPDYYDDDDDDDEHYFDDVRDILTSRRLQIVPEIELGHAWCGSDSEVVEQLLQTLGRLQKLKIIHGLGHLDLSGVEERIVSCLVNMVEEIVMDGYSGYNAMPETVKTILSVIRQDTQLRRIECNSTNLSSIQPDSLATAVHRLVDVDMAGTSLTTEQLTHILLKINEKSKLKYLNIKYNDCSSVKPDIMANVNKLEVVKMADTHLTTVQLTSILTQAVKNTKLKLMDFSGNEWNYVDQELVGKAEQKIDELIYGYIDDNIYSDDSSDSDDS